MRALSLLGMRCRRLEGGPWAPGVAAGPRGFSGGGALVHPAWPQREWERDRRVRVPLELQTHLQALQAPEPGDRACMLVGAICL